MDALFKQMKRKGMGCHVCPVYAGAFGHADDVALVAPSLYSLSCMVKTAKNLQIKYEFKFHPTKSKMLCLNTNHDDAPHITGSCSYSRYTPW